MNQPTKMNHLTKNQRNNRRQKPEGFTKTKTKNSRTETVSVPSKTPEKSINVSSQCIAYKNRFVRFAQRADPSNITIEIHT